MKKQILLISNPGEQGAENYCGGVERDIVKYTNYFKSPLGGYWYENEINHLNRPTVNQLKVELKKLVDYSYAKIIFCGHGWYSISMDDTILELRKNEEIALNSLKVGAKKQTVILDSCRETYPDRIADSIIKLAKGELPLNALECRKYYENRIQECKEDLIVLYACSKGEKSYDSSEDGGFYSSSLMKVCNEFADENIKSIDLSKNVSLYSIVQAHISCCEKVIKKSGNRQHPQIDKPGCDKYFPFAILA